MRLRSLQLFLLAALGTALAAGTAACERKSEGVIQVAVIGDAPRLAEPRGGPLSAGQAVLVGNVAQGLVRFDARGQVEPGLAETWNVSDDGQSYIFRLANAEWPDGRKITAQQVARLLRRLIAPSRRTGLTDSLSAVEEVVAMTDRVIEIRLRQPRPHLLQLLAQPELGLVFEGQGSGPFRIDRANSSDRGFRLTREIVVPDEEEPETEEVDLTGLPAEQAVRAFVAGEADLVLGGTFADLPYAQRADLARGALRFDPASGLFGLVPARKSGLLADSELRQLLNQAIDRDALVEAFSVPGLIPRTTVLEPGLDGLSDPVEPDWVATPLAERRPALVAAAGDLLRDEESRVVRVVLPPGPGSDIVLQRLTQDWGALGLAVERAGAGESADLRLVDLVAPSTSPAWFLRRFSCRAATLCDADLDELLDGAATTAVTDQRRALFAEAASRIDSQQLFIPIAAPIRWSLVSGRINGFAGNRFAIHTLTGLEERLNRAGE
ncbi:MAG TPA: ABC transporter substrate-binding protein [Sphingomicrobium sp.]|nr:ABC transporter substrate-binding protein [Sphingomicrobium sp.]